MSSTTTSQAKSPEWQTVDPSRKTIFRVGAVLLGVLVAALLLEASLWVFGITPNTALTKRHLRYYGDDNAQVGFHCYPSNPDGEFSPLPDMTQGTWKLYSYSLPPEELPLELIEETPWSVGYFRNNMGYRGVEFTAEPAEGVERIGVVGDSFVFGEGVQVEGTLPVQLNQVLGPRYELINLGQVGAFTGQEMVATYSAVESLDTHRILFVFLINDVGVTETLAAQQDFINDLIIFRDAHLSARNSGAWYKGHSRLLDFIGSQMQMRSIEQDTIQWYRDCYDPAKNGNNLLQLESYFHELAALPTCEVAMVIYPLLEGFEDEYPFTEIHERVSNMATRAGLPVLDLAPAFAGIKSSGLWVHPADHHPNRRANGIAAKTIVSWLRREVPDFLTQYEASDEVAESNTAELEPELAEQVIGDLEQGAAFFQQGRFFDARLRFLRVLSRDPNNAVARLYLGIIADNEGRLTEAVVHYREALRLRPGWADAANNLATTLILMPKGKVRDPEEAIRLAEIACQATDYTSIRHLDTLVTAYGQAGQYQKAIDTALWALDLEDTGDDPAIVEQLGLKLAQYREILAQNPPAEDELDIETEVTEEGTEEGPSEPDSDPAEKSPSESSEGSVADDEGSADESTPVEINSERSEEPASKDEPQA